MRFGCSGCGRTLEVSEELAGRRVRCPACRIVAFAPAADVPEVQPIDEIEEVRPLAEKAPLRRPPHSKYGGLAIAGGSLLYAIAFHLLLVAGFVVAWDRLHRADPAANAVTQPERRTLVQPVKSKWDTRETMARNACRERLAAVTRAIDIWKREHGSWPASLAEVLRDTAYGSCRAEYEMVEETSEGVTRRVRQVSCPEHRIRIEFGAERIGKG